MKIQPTTRRLIYLVLLVSLCGSGPAAAQSSQEHRPLVTSATEQHREMQDKKPTDQGLPGDAVIQIVRTDGAETSTFSRIPSTNYNADAYAEDDCD
jgi:hypothetical protein